MRDEYDDHMDELRANNSIIQDWDEVKPLFRVLGPERNSPSRVKGVREFCSPWLYGCPTQIKSQPARFCAITPELTKKILEDRRIPCSKEQITLESLPAFAEYQRAVDEILKSH